MHCTTKIVVGLEPGHKSFKHIFHRTVELSLPLGFGDKSYGGWVFLIKKI